MKNAVKQNSEISEREIQALIRQSLDQVQVYDEFSTGKSEISGTYYVLSDGRILREYHKLNASEVSYTFVDKIAENSCTIPLEDEAPFSAWMKDLGKTSVDIVKGTGKGLFDVGKDLVTGIVDVVTNPGETIKSTVEAIRHPDQTYRAIKSAITESYERDIINGDAYSRANWFSYAVGTVATSVVGTKGLGAVGKTGVATTKTAAQTGISVTKNAIESSSLANLLPYAPRPQLAMAGDVPFNALNGAGLKDQLISMARVESVGKGTDKVVKEYDVIPYRPANGKYGLENHHGVMNEWAKSNIPGYKEKVSKSPTVALSDRNNGGMHEATKKVYREWLRERTGRPVGAKVDWENVSPKEMQKLSEEMFDAAKVPEATRREYYSQLNKFLYSLD